MTKKLTLKLILLALLCSLCLTPVLAHEGGHEVGPSRIQKLETVVTLLEYIAEFLEVHGRTLVERGVVIPQVHVTIPEPVHQNTDKLLVTFVVETDHVHALFRNSDEHTHTTIIDSDLDDREAVYNELVLFTRLPEETVRAITIFP